MQKHFIAHINFAKGFRGGERQTLLLISSLAKLGIKQKILLRKNSSLIERLENIKNLQIIPVSKPYIFHFSLIKDVTLLHAHETKAAQFAFFCHQLLKIPYIVTRRVDNPIKNNLLNKYIYQKAFRTVALSQAIKKEILNISNNAKIDVIPSAFTPITPNKKKVEALKEKYKDYFVIGHIGALDDKQKGQSVLIQTAKKLEKTHPNIIILFVGGGEDETYLKNLAKERKNIQFIGFINNVEDYIAIFDLFVFPSNNEGLGSILLDIFYGGVAIIATKVGGIIDIIHHNENGLLIDPKNNSQLYDAIIKLYNDPKLRQKFIQQSQYKLKEYSVDTMTSKYLSLYNQEISK